MKAIDLSAPDDVLPNWLAAMRRGDYEAAWQQTDRIEIPRRSAQREPGFSRGEHHLVWNGEGWEDRTVLVRCWHGLGDTIQFLRFVPVVRRTARKVIVQAQPMLLSLLEGMDGIDELLNGWTDDPDPAHDVEIECMEFPYALRCRAEEVPCRVPYLPVERLRSCGPQLGPAAGECRIGLIWASSSWDSSRSVPLRLFAPLAEVPGVRLYSLQQGPERAEVQSVAFPIVDLADHTADAAAAAGAMLQMDAMVVVDTMGAHLAGALGRPTHTILQHQADWRWQDERLDCPWYPTMRLYRQPSAGDWAGAIDGVVREAALQAARGL